MPLLCPRLGWFRVLFTLLLLGMSRPSQAVFEKWGTYSFRPPEPSAFQLSENGLHGTLLQLKTTPTLRLRRRLADQLAEAFVARLEAETNSHEENETLLYLRRRQGRSKRFLASILEGLIANNFDQQLSGRIKEGLFRAMSHQAAAPTEVSPIGLELLEKYYREFDDDTIRFFERDFRIWVKQWWKRRLETEESLLKMKESSDIEFEAYQRVQRELTVLEQGRVERMQALLKAELCERSLTPSHLNQRVYLASP